MAWPRHGEIGSAAVATDRPWISPPPSGEEETRFYAVFYMGTDTDQRERPFDAKGLRTALATYESDALDAKARGKVLHRRQAHLFADAVLTIQDSSEGGLVSTELTLFPPRSRAEGEAIARTLGEPRGLLGPGGIPFERPFHQPGPETIYDPVVIYQRPSQLRGPSDMVTVRLDRRGRCWRVERISAP